MAAINRFLRVNTALNGLPVGKKSPSKKDQGRIPHSQYLLASF